MGGGRFSARVEHHAAHDALIEKLRGRRLLRRFLSQGSHRSSLSGGRRPAPKPDTAKPPETEIDTAKPPNRTLRCPPLRVRPEAANQARAFAARRQTDPARPMARLVPAITSDAGSGTADPLNCVSSVMLSVIGAPLPLEKESQCTALSVRSPGILADGFPPECSSIRLGLDQSS